MKVRDLMKELIDLDPEADIRINILGGGMPDNLEYHTGNHYFMIDYSNTSDAYDIYFSAMDFKNNKDDTLVDLLRQCKPTGYGVTEFPEYLRSYDETKKN